jgi:hypothetical protein
MENLTEFCEAWLNTWTGNRPDLLLSFYAEDTFYLDPANKKGLRGHAELLPYLQKLLKYNPDWKWRTVEIMETAKGFTLKWEARIPVGDGIIKEVGLDIVELSNGKISRNEVYFDRADWLKVVGQK